MPVVVGIFLGLQVRKTLRRTSIPAAQSTQEVIPVGFAGNHSSEDKRHLAAPTLRAETQDGATVSVDSDAPLKSEAARALASKEQAETITTPAGRNDTLHRDEDKRYLAAQALRASSQNGATVSVDSDAPSKSEAARALASENHATDKNRRGVIEHGTLTGADGAPLSGPSGFGLTGAATAQSRRVVILQPDEGADGAPLSGPSSLRLTGAATAESRRVVILQPETHQGAGGASLGAATAESRRVVALQPENANTEHSGRDSAHQ